MLKELSAGAAALLEAWEARHLAAMRASKRALSADPQLHRFFERRFLEGAPPLTPFAAAAPSSRGRLRFLCSRVVAESLTLTLEFFPPGMMMNLVSRSHETFCAFFAPPTDAVVRWQRSFIVVTTVMGILTVAIWRVIRPVCCRTGVCLCPFPQWRRAASSSGAFGQTDPAVISSLPGHSHLSFLLCDDRQVLPGGLSIAECCRRALLVAAPFSAQQPSCLLAPPRCVCRLVLLLTSSAIAPLLLFSLAAPLSHCRIAPTSAATRSAPWRSARTSWPSPPPAGASRGTAAPSRASTPRSTATRCRASRAASSRTRRWVCTTSSRASS